MQIRLKPVQDEDLPFSKATDVFAYGTVWFELITHELPYKRLHPEVHIWQGAKGRLPIPEGKSRRGFRVDALMQMERNMKIVWIEYSVVWTKTAPADPCVDKSRPCRPISISTPDPVTLPATPFLATITPPLFYFHPGSRDMGPDIEF